MKEATIGNATLRSIRIIAEGNLTRNYMEEDRVLLDDDKLSIGGLDIEKDDRDYWCDTSLDEIHYDELIDRTIIDLELWDDPDANPDSKQNLTEEDLFSNAEFYLWMEYASDFSPNVWLIVESDKPWSKERVTTEINIT